MGRAVGNRTGADPVERHFALPSNPFSLIGNSLAWRSIVYCFTSIFVGLAALAAGLIGFAALPLVARRVTGVEQRRVAILRLPRLGGIEPSTGAAIAVWGATMLFGLVSLIVGAVLVGSVTVLVWMLLPAITALANAGPDTFWPRIAFFLAILLALWAAVMCGLYVAWGLAVAQTRGVRRILAAQADLSQQVADLASSRNELVDTFESERRRIERDLHDGAQQHLVVATMRLGEAVYWLDETNPDDARGCVLTAQQSIEDALAALRTTIRGLHPQVLTERGLVAAVRELAARQPVPTTLETSGVARPLPPAVENAAYHVLSEALTNVAKHAGASSAVVRLDFRDGLTASVCDDGAGGARSVGGHGLSGLAERMAAVGGALTITSPEGGPTLVSAKFALDQTESPDQSDRTDQTERPGGAPSES